MVSYDVKKNKKSHAENQADRRGNSMKKIGPRVGYSSSSITILLTESFTYIIMISYISPCTFVGADL